MFGGGTASIAVVEEKKRLSDDEVVAGSSDRSFGFVIATVLAVIGLWPLMFGGGLRAWALGLALLFFL